MPERNKHFAEWMNVKDDLHRTGRIPNVKDGDIWWCSVGENVGVEINGKSSLFSRPVLVLKKISRYGFLGVPLTSKEHSGSWYASFVFQDKKQTAALAQVRTFSVSRLHNRIGTLTIADLSLVRRAFDQLYSW